MLFPIKQLLVDRGAPLCVKKDTTLKSALTLMVEHDYSQLPIVDDDEKLTGIVCNESLISTYFHTGGLVPLLDLPVVNCQTMPVTISPDSDIFEALDLLQSVYAIVVVEEDKPVGILTDFDTTAFFREVSEGLILVEDIEVTLRQYIESIYPEEDDLNKALIHAFGARRSDPDIPNRDYERLSMGNTIQLITHHKNWPDFNKYFEPIELFEQLMHQIRQIRNQLAHFRGSMEPIQANALLRGRDWLAARPRPLNGVKEGEQTVQIQQSDIPDQKGTGKYSTLHNWLAHPERKAQGTHIHVKMVDIETIIADKLPPSARKHRSWWSNHLLTHTQAAAWMRAGWVVDDVDFNREVVTFRQTRSAYYQGFFTDMIEDFKKRRPGVTQANASPLANWCWFSAGKPGIYFGWTLPRERVLRIECYIDVGDQEYNKTYFDQLTEVKDKIEEQIGETLAWERLDDRRASRVSKSKPFDVASEIDKRAHIKEWGVDMLIKFIDAFQPHIRNLK